MLARAHTHTSLPSHPSCPPQLVLDVEPLESGRSADTTGRLVVTRRDTAAAVAAPGSAAAAAGAAADGGGLAAPGSRQLCYKLGETGARYVAV